MYTVLPASQVVSAADRDAAVQLQKDLQQNNPDEQWRIFREAETADLENPLERLYALCYRLVGNQDPSKLTLVVANVDGTETAHSVLSIMLAARQALDAGAGE